MMRKRPIFFVISLPILQKEKSKIYVTKWFFTLEVVPRGSFNFWLPSFSFSLVVSRRCWTISSQAEVKLIYSCHHHALVDWVWSSNPGKREKNILNKQISGIPDVWSWSNRIRFSDRFRSLGMRSRRASSWLKYEQWTQSDVLNQLSGLLRGLDAKQGHSIHHSELAEASIVWDQRKVLHGCHFQPTGDVVIDPQGAWNSMEISVGKWNRSITSWRYEVRISWKREEKSIWRISTTIT